MGRVLKFINEYCGLRYAEHVIFDGKFLSEEDLDKGFFGLTYCDMPFAKYSYDENENPHFIFLRNEDPSKSWAWDNDSVRYFNRFQEEKFQSILELEKGGLL